MSKTERKRNKRIKNIRLRHEAYLNSEAYYAKQLADAKQLFLTYRKATLS